MPAHPSSGANALPRKRNLFVISAPSGAGKTSLISALIESDSSLRVSVSYTTRRRRAAERDGVHYHFVGASEFEAMRAAGEFLEWATVFGHSYGTSEQTVREALRAGSDVILEIDWQGARQVRERWPRSVAIFVLPPCRAALAERLRGRGQDAAEVIAKRTAQAVEDIAHCREFDHLVVNDDFQQALRALRRIVAASRAGETLARADHSALLAELLS